MEIEFHQISLLRHALAAMLRRIDWELTPSVALSTPVDEVCRWAREEILALDDKLRTAQADAQATDGDAS